MKGNRVAQKTQVVLIDDIDGGRADETVTFSLDGVSYEIDLSDEHAAELREAFKPYVAGARRTGGRAVVRRAGRRRAASGDGSRTAQVREWARAQGYTVSDRGRISREVSEAYGRAHA